MKARVLAPALALALSPALPAAASTATIAQIVGNPSGYAGRHVEVRGTVQHVRRNISHQGNPYVTFSLCSGKCVRVFAFADSGPSEGAVITVNGVYATVNYINGYTLYGGIKADGGPRDTESPCS